MDKVRPVPGAGPFGLAIFLASLAVLFAASLVAYWAVRAGDPTWGEGLPPMPRSLWLSTALLLVSSGTVHLALRAAKTDDRPGVARFMVASTALGAVFLACQLHAWWTLVGQDVTGRENLFGFTFYVLTGVHGAHVIAGVIPLAVTTARAFAGRYGKGDHDGVTMCAMYWHFLDVVWLVIFANLTLF